MKLRIAPDVFLWRACFALPAQQVLLSEVLKLLEKAPLYRPVMPKSGKPFSVEESNFGDLGWVSDRSGYRYQKLHPVAGRPWPEIPHLLLQLWDEIAGPEPVNCCLVNLYRAGARMGLHQDRDENDLTAPVIGVSLGDDAVFRIGGVTRSAPTRTIRLASGDVVWFGGTARLAYHGIDRVVFGSSRLVPGGGRLSLTLRRVKL